MTMPLAKPLVPDRHVAVTIASPGLPASFTNSMPAVDVEDALELVETEFLPTLAGAEIGVAGRNCFETHALVCDWLRDVAQDAFRGPDGAERQALLGKLGPIAMWSAFTHPHNATEMRRNVARHLHGPAGKANILVVFAFLADAHAHWAFCVAKDADDPEPTIRQVLDQLFAPPPKHGGDGPPRAAW